MLKTIFLFETKRWFKGFSFYLYFLAFFALSFFTMASSLGYFDNFTITTASNTLANSPYAINGLINGLSTFIQFIVPSVIGATIYRDFKYNSHQLLYSYPFNKKDYILGKFLSGFVITLIITLSIGIAFYLATILPFANSDLLGKNSFYAYIQSYILFVVPNIFFIGALIFMIVTLSRNVTAGFITVLVIFILNALIANLTINVDDDFIISLFDPSGSRALEYVVKYWTIEKQNHNSIPFANVILLNRAIWIGLGILCFLIVYFFFSFNHQPISLKRKKKGEVVTKNNFGSIIKINLPKVNLSYSFKDQLITTWNISKIEFRAILTNWTFIVPVVMLLIFIVGSGFTLGQDFYGTRTYPVTWKVTQLAMSNVQFFLTIIIYLFAGILIQRSTATRMNLLVDSTPIPNWSLLLSKFLTLNYLTWFILALSILACIGIQIAYGYYHFEIKQYLQHFFVFGYLRVLVLIVFALFIQSFFRNYIIGFFVTLLLQLVVLKNLDQIGLELSIFDFNSSHKPSYSDMNGFGSVREFFYYRLYWILFASLLYIATLAFWRRGVLSGVKERLKLATKRMNSILGVLATLFLFGFLGLGYAIYYDETQIDPYYTSKEYEELSVEYEKKYKKYQKLTHPRIVDVNVQLDLFPKERRYEVLGKFLTVNKSNQPIDKIYIEFDKKDTEAIFEKEISKIESDRVHNVHIFHLKTPLLPGDTLALSYKRKSKPNRWLSDHSPILENGTFINNSVLFPSFGYNENLEIEHNDIRKKYNLPPKERMDSPDNMEARMNTYISSEADWIDFETVVSTDEDQIAVAPGYLQKKWKEKGRNYFHYKMDQKILNFYAYNSARYEVKREKVNGIDFEIYYHKGHEYNLDRMMKAMKDAIGYYSQNFSLYQFRQARIIEFPSVLGTFAQAFANTMPFSESIGFIADVDEEDPNAIDYPYSVVSHEMAHQWWAHQVIGAKVKGATMLSESLSEYSSLKVLEKKYGKTQMHKFLKEALDSYLSGRKHEWKEENPLMYNENQQYIHYNKGALVFYALSDLLGEDKFHNILRNYINKVAFQEPPYTISRDLVEMIRKGTPQDLQYLIADMFENITLYENKTEKVEVKQLDNGKYQVDVHFIVSKHRADNKGKMIFEDNQKNTLKTKLGGKEIQSYPLNDFIEVGVFAINKGKYETKRELALKKYRIKDISNKVTFIVDEKPDEVGVDPYNKLIDLDSNDNRKKVN